MPKHVVSLVVLLVVGIVLLIVSIQKDNVGAAFLVTVGIVWSAVAIARRLRSTNSQQH